MDICLDDIITEAKCCSGNLGHKVIRAAIFGNATDEMWFELMRLNSYIKTLERNKKKYITKKETVTVEPEKVDFNSLHHNEKTLYLKSEQKVICTKVEITPCLTDSDISKIIEEIRLLCSTCNCNCKQ